MNQSARPVHVGRDVSFRTPAGEPIECVTVWLWSTTPLSARLLLTAHQWDPVRSNGLFDSHTLDLPTDFSPADSLLLDLEAVDASLPTDAPTVKKRFADPGSQLRSTDAWTATGVRDHESAGGLEPESESNGGKESAADAPRVNDVGISMHQSRPAAASRTATETGGSGTDPSDWEDLTDPLSHVAADLTADNRPFESAADGTHLSLTATVDHASWDVVIQDTTATDAQNDTGTDTGANSHPDSHPDTNTEAAGPCLIRSLFPDRLGETRRNSLQPELDAYTETLNRGGFVVGSTAGTATGEDGCAVEFRTPFDPVAESTGDALTENVTGLAEWFDRLTD